MLNYTTKLRIGIVLSTKTCIKCGKRSRRLVLTSSCFINDDYMCGMVSAVLACCNKPTSKIGDVTRGLEGRLVTKHNAQNGAVRWPPSNAAGQNAQGDVKRDRRAATDKS